MNMWANEFTKARGNKAAIFSRLRFHGLLSVGAVVEYAGLSRATVRKHFKALVAEGVAQFWGNEADCIRYIPESV